MESEERTVRIAAAQYSPHVGDLAGNREAAARWVAASAERGARLVVLPELASSGYVFADLAEAEALAEDVDGPFVSALAAMAREHDLTIVSGLCERDGGRLYNSAVTVGPSGLLGTYRKLHLFNDEKSWFAPGDRGLPVVDTPAGRVGMVICYDLWFPEAIRTLAVGGAEIIAVPTNWVSAFKPRVYDEHGYVQGDYVAMVSAAQSGVAVVCADRIGVERGLGFIGASVIVGPDGWPLAGPASPDGEELLVADVDMTRVEAARRRTPRNHLLDDRRPDAYVTSPPVPAAAGGRRTRP